MLQSDEKSCAGIHEKCVAIIIYPGSWIYIYIYMCLLCNMYLHKSSQAVNKCCGLRSLGEKSCKIKDGSQEMTAMMLMLINRAEMIMIL